MKKLLRNPRVITTAGLMWLWGVYATASILDPSWLPMLAFGLVDLGITAFALWPYRRRQRPGSVVSLHDWQGMVMARKQMARRRPWLWGPLKHLWVYSFHRLEFPMVAGPTYRWKTRADRRIEKSLHQCCGVPEGQRCPSHEEQS